MKNVLINNKEVTLTHVDVHSNGFGTKKIVCEIKIDDNWKHFSAITHNMKAFDLACDIENYDEKLIAFFEIVASEIEEKIKECLTTSKV